MTGRKQFSSVVYRDFRGMIRTLHQPSIKIAETALSTMYEGVLKGIHGDLTGRNWKILTCVAGRIFHVAVNRKTLQWEANILTPEGPSVMLAPGMGSAVLALRDSSLLYQQSEVYIGAHKQFTIRWDDPALKIDWPMRSKLILSQRDASAPFLEAQ